MPLLMSAYPLALVRKGELSEAVTLLGRIYGDADDWESMVALLGPRLAAATDDQAKIEILTDTAGLLERRRGDAAGAFDAIWRAFSIVPSAALGADAVRLAASTDRWTVISGATQCRLNLTQTAKTGTERYRASTPGCQLPKLAVVSSWQLAGSQVQLFDENGDMVAALILSGTRFIGTLSGGQGISMIG